jgi:preprotein translocase subunit SecD
MGKPLAIGIDNRVYSAPILKDEITTGTCEISGNFTLNEVVMLKSLINTNELPLEFKLVK